MRAGPSNTIDITSGSLTMKVRGLRAPGAGCKLSELLVMYNDSGRSSACRKQAGDVGRGREFLRMLASLSVVGRPETPFGVLHPFGSPATSSPSSSFGSPAASSSVEGAGAPPPVAAPTADAG